MANASLSNYRYVLLWFWYSEADNVYGTDYDGTPARTPVAPQTPGHRRQHQPPPIPLVVTTNTPAGTDNPFLVASNRGNTSTPQQPWHLSPIHEPPCSPTLSSMSSNHCNVPGNDNDYQNIFAPSPVTTQPSYPPPCTPGCQHSHTAVVARDGLAGNKMAHKAKDVWAFFDKTGGHSVCCCSMRSQGAKQDKVSASSKKICVLYIPKQDKLKEC